VTGVLVSEFAPRPEGLDRWKAGPYSRRGTLWQLEPALLPEALMRRPVGWCTFGLITSRARPLPTTSLRASVRKHVVRSDTIELPHIPGQSAVRPRGQVARVRPGPKGGHVDKVAPRPTGNQ